MKVFSSQGKFNVFIIFLILAISSSLVGKLTSTYDKDILFKLVLTDLPKDKVVYDKSHDSVMLKVRGYGFNLAKYYFGTPSLHISVKKLKESNNTFLWNQKDNFNEFSNANLKQSMNRFKSKSQTSEVIDGEYEVIKDNENKKN